MPSSPATLGSGLPPRSSFVQSVEMSRIGVAFGLLAIHAPRLWTTPSSTATSQSLSSGGRTVTR